MRFHLLALPNVQTTKAYSLDGFCTATIKFARMLKALGHMVYLYASEENDAPCDELITVITKEEQQTLLDTSRYQYAQFNDKYPLWQLSNRRTIKELAKRKESHDFICSIGGMSQYPIAVAHSDLMFVEYSIGYISSFAKYRVYESHIWRHCTHGFQDDQQGRFFDTVIPYFFDEHEFPFRAKKEPFALYVGRITPKKGVALACQAAHHAGLPLKVIGHGFDEQDLSLLSHGAEYLGALPDDERNDYLSRATCLICPTLYLEPFGAMAVEAQMCGTPVVSTDFGAFVETVEQGRTGFRCTYLGEFVRGIQHAHTLDADYIRGRAVAKYSMHHIQYDYQRYFTRLSLLWNQGFDTIERIEDDGRLHTGTVDRRQGDGEWRSEHRDVAKTEHHDRFAGHSSHDDYRDADRRAHRHAAGRRDGDRDRRAAIDGRIRADGERPVHPELVDCGPA